MTLQKFLTEFLVASSRNVWQIKVLRADFWRSKKLPPDSASKLPDMENQSWFLCHLQYVLCLVDVGHKVVRSYKVSTFCFSCDFPASKQIEFDTLISGLVQAQNYTAVRGTDPATPDSRWIGPPKTFCLGQCFKAVDIFIFMETDATLNHKTVLVFSELWRIHLHN